MKEIMERRSIRRYKTDAVRKEDLEAIILAGTKAPSAKNRQPWKYIVYSADAKNQLLDEMEKGLIRERDGNKVLPKSQHGLADAFYTLNVMREAPVLIMIVNTNGRSPFEDIDVDERVTEICDTLSIGASVENMLLTATELGYGALWIANTYFAYEELVNYMEITGQLIGAVSLGLPAENPNPRPRKSMEEVVEYRA